jgi:hypothetical protein
MPSLRGGGVVEEFSMIGRSGSGLIHTERALVALVISSDFAAMAHSERVRRLLRGIDYRVALSLPNCGSEPNSCMTLGWSTLAPSQW